MTPEQILIADKIDALYAYDNFSTGGGIRDDEFKASLVERDDIDLLMHYLVCKLTPEQGYTFEDVINFMSWAEIEVYESREIERHDQVNVASPVE